MERGKVAGVTAGRCLNAYRLPHSGSTALGLTHARLRNSLHSMVHMNAASDSARRPLRGSLCSASAIARASVQVARQALRPHYLKGTPATRVERKEKRNREWLTDRRLLKATRR